MGRFECGPGTADIRSHALIVIGFFGFPHLPGVRRREATQPRSHLPDFPVFDPAEIPILSANMSLRSGIPGLPAASPQ